MFRNPLVGKLLIPNYGMPGLFCRVWLAGLMLFQSSTTRADEQLSLLGSSVKDVQEASAVLYTLSQRNDLRLTDVLSGMRGQNAISQNWYLSLAQTIADRDPVRALEECREIIGRTSEESSARYWAFTFLTDRQPESREPLLETMLTDPSPELRYEAIALKLSRLDSSPSTSQESKQAAFRELLKEARLPSQVVEIAKRLEDSGSPVNLLEHFGFIKDWYTIGSFDNSGLSGFNVAYDPELDYLAGKLMPDAKLLQSDGYQGRSSLVGWVTTSTEEDDGSINLATAYNKEKGAVVYALSSFVSPTQVDGVVGIGSQNAVKVWVNGKELIGREVYHAGGQIDQYTASVSLNEGVNTVLVKVCQNEQTEPWAQSWYFQLRFCDSTGLALRQVE